MNKIKLLEKIKGNAAIAYYHSLYTIKGRWPEAEDIIKKDPTYAYWYAINIIGARWPEAEEVIKKGNMWNLYLSLVCTACNGDGVVDSGIAGTDQQCLKCHGGGLDL